MNTGVFLRRLGTCAVLLFFTAVSVAEAMPTAACEKPLPNDATVVSPAAGVLPERARYSGFWVGKWDAKNCTALVVESVTETGATVIYHSRNGSWRASAEFGDRGDLRFSLVDGKACANFAYRIRPEDGRLVGTFKRCWKQAISLAELSREE